MYDKIRITGLDGYKTSNILDHLNNTKTSISKITGQLFYRCDIGTLLVLVHFDTIVIMGSLCKYYYGDNLHGLDRKTTKKAFEKLSTALNTDITDYKVTQLEFGTNFLMAEPIGDYTKFLGDTPRLKRVGYETSVYYRSKSANHIFYDKGAELMAKYGLELPFNPSYHLMRYELRFKNRLATQLNTERVTVGSLYDEVFYRYLIKRFLNIYLSINKKQTLKSNAMNEIQNPRDAENLFITEILLQSGTNAIEDFIQRLKDNDVFSNRNDLKRVKGRLSARFNDPQYTERTRLIRELDNEVKNVTIYQ